MVQNLARCIIPVGEGTLVVFSNFAMIHRVLPILAEEGRGSRDFLAFFVVDQRNPLSIPENLGPRSERLNKRHELLTEQLQSKAHFGLDRSLLFSTGNGKVTDVAWVAAGFQQDRANEDIFFD